MQVAKPRGSLDLLQLLVGSMDAWDFPWLVLVFILEALLIVDDHLRRSPQRARFKLVAHSLHSLGQ